VEINGQMVVDLLSVDDSVKDKKVDMLLEEEMLDDAFVIDTSGDIPPELIVTAKTLLLQPADFNTLQKLQKPKITHDIRDALIRVLEARMGVYSTSIEEDECHLKNHKIPKRMLNVIIVRVGEKRILRGAIENLQGWEDVGGRKKRQRIE